MYFTVSHWFKLFFVSNSYIKWVQWFTFNFEASSSCFGFLIGRGLCDRNLRCSQNDFDFEFFLFGLFWILRRQPLIFTSSLSRLYSSESFLPSSLSLVFASSSFSTRKSGLPLEECWGFECSTTGVSLNVWYVPIVCLRLLLRRSAPCFWFLELIPFSNLLWSVEYGVLGASDAYS